MDKDNRRDSVLASIHARRGKCAGHDHFTVLTEWGSPKFFDVQGRAWAFTGSLTVLPRKTSDCDLLEMTRDVFGAVAERPSSGIRYLCVHCDISALIHTDDAKEAEVPVRGFLQTTKSRMSSCKKQRVRARSNANHSLDRPAKEQGSNNRSKAIA